MRYFFILLMIVSCNTTTEKAVDSIELTLEDLLSVKDEETFMRLCVENNFYFNKKYEDKINFLRRPKGYMYDEADLFKDGIKGEYFYYSLNLITSEYNTKNRKVWIENNPYDKILKEVKNKCDFVQSKFEINPSIWEKDKQEVAAVYYSCNGIIISLYSDHNKDGWINVYFKNL